MKEETKEAISQHISCLKDKFWKLEAIKNSCRYASNTYYRYLERQRSCEQDIIRGKELLKNSELMMEVWSE